MSDAKPLTTADAATLEAERDAARDRRRAGVGGDAVSVSDRPILLSAPMVRALLDGRKTQTRRLVKPQPHPRHYLQPAWGRSPPPNPVDFGTPWTWTEAGPDYPDGPDDERTCPYGVPGDELWVKETSIVAPADWTSDRETVSSQHVMDKDGRPRLIQYLATQPDRDAANDYGLKASPSIFMPRWASRITLRIESVRVERLQDISEEDAKAEGIESAVDDGMTYWGPIGKGHCDPIQAYRLLWESINGFGSWNANPWVWVLSFSRTKP